MYSHVAQSGKAVYGIKHFVVDTTAEVQELPTNCHMGSTAFVIETSETYMINGQRKWVKVVFASEAGSGSGSGTGSNSEEVHIVYDGGSVGGW